MTDSAHTPKRVFIGYSHRDETWKDRLHTQLKVLEQQNQLAVWEDRQIAAGADWYPAIEQAINSAQVAVLLISADFLTSKFILDEEVPRLLERRRKDGLQIIPLILRPCAWQAVPWLASIQGRPKDNRPLTKFNKNNVEQCLADLAIEISALINKKAEATDHALQIQRSEYLRYIIETYKYLDFKAIANLNEAAKGSSGISLESVYVPLRARLDTPDAETWHRLGGRLYCGATAVMEADPEKREQDISRAESAALIVEQWLEQQPALVILGDPGSGKSTTMKRLALQLAQQDDGPLPILIPLNAYSKALEKGEMNFEEFLPEYYQGKRAQLKRDTLKRLFTQALQQNQAVVLMDGLDEVGTNRGLLVAQIESFVRVWITEHPIRESYQDRDKPAYERDLKQWQQTGNRMVATSRFVGYRDYPLTDPRWQTVALNDWNRAEIEQFFQVFTYASERAWQGGEHTEEVTQKAQDECKSLLQIIDANLGIRRLAGNPLLSSIMALIKRQRISLPNRRVELYKIYMETLLSCWSRARSLDRQAIGPDIEFSSTQPLLAKLALHLRQTNPQGGLIEEKAMKDYLRNYFMDDGFDRKAADEQAKAFLDSVHRYSSLLIEKGQHQYGFIHLTFEEYLAGFGLALEDESVLLRLFPEYLQQPEQWRETLLLSVGVMAVLNSAQKKANVILDSLLQTAEADTVLFVGAALKDIGPKDLGNRMTRRIQQSLLDLGQDERQTLSIRRRAGLLLGDSSWLPDDLDRMIAIPKGSFLYGDNKMATEIINDYWIGQYPVTNAQFKRFMEAGGYQDKTYWTEEGWNRRTEENWLQPGLWDDSGWANPLSPVVGVSWYEALAYCCWLQTELSAHPKTYGLPDGVAGHSVCRLPTNEEWERAARGLDGRQYPWGNALYPEWLNCLDSWEKGSDDKGTTGVGLFVSGVSPEGLHDCAGNVWEWTSALDENGIANIRGGAWVNRAGVVRCAYRGGNHPYNRYNYIGFRVVLGGVLPGAF